MLYESFDKKICYAHAPKTASRTVLAWLALCENPKRFEESPEWFAPSKHRDEGEYSLLKEWVKETPVLGNKHEWSDGWLPAVRHPIRFCITRDPVARFVSGFRNRVLFHGHAEQFNLKSIDDFIEKFDEIIAADINIRFHTMPQWWFYGTRKGWFTHIIPLAEIGQLKSLLEMIYEVKLPDLHLQQSGKIAKPAISQEIENWILHRYAIDVALFGRSSA